MIVTSKQLVKKPSIAIFPLFSPLRNEFMTEYNSVANQDKNLACDLSWGGLFIWLNYYNDLEISELNGNFVLKYHNIFTGKSSYSLCGQEKIPETLETLFNSPELGIYELENISQTIVNKIDPTKYSVEEDRDSFDYLLDVNQQVELSGTLYGKQRRKINKFIKSTGVDVTIKQIDIADHSVRENIINTMHTWDSLYSFGGNDSSHLEGLAINRALINVEQIPLGCIGIYVHDKLEGFTLFQIRSQYTLIHHTKVSYNFPNIFDFAVYATISHLKTRGVSLINFEQDLGIPGLREHKSGLRPISMLKKFIVTKRENQ